MNRFRGECLPADTRPLTAADRRRANIPSRFNTRQEYRDFMRSYVQRWRAEHPRGQRTNAPVVEGSPEQIAQSLRASTSRRRPGYCALCGHATPVDTCPVCAAEQLGQPITVHTWDALIGAIEI